jgi:hypothetical protein
MEEDNSKPECYFLGTRTGPTGEECFRYVDLKTKKTFLVAPSESLEEKLAEVRKEFEGKEVK